MRGDMTRIKESDLRKFTAEFCEAARELGADVPEEHFEKALKRVAGGKQPKDGTIRHKRPKGS